MNDMQSYCRATSGRPSLIVIVMTLLISAATVRAEVLNGSDWPGWRGPNANGISPEAGWNAASPKVLWSAEIGNGYGTVAVAGGRAYAMGSDGERETVFCFDAASGDTIWTHTYPAELVPNLHEGGPSATPTVYEGLLYTHSKDGLIHCVNAEDGAVIWQADLKQLLSLDVPMWGFCSSGVIVDDKIVFQAGATIALDRKSGDVIWKSKEYDPAYTTPALFESGSQKRLAVLNSWGLVILDEAGNELSKYEWQTDFDTNATTPIVIGDKIFVSTGYDKGCILFQYQNDRLKPLYRRTVLSNHVADSLVIDGYVYGFDGQTGRQTTALVCMELATGKEQWRQQGMGAGTLIASDGKLIVLSDDGDLVIAEATPRSFKAISRTQVFGEAGASKRDTICWTAPTMAHGRIYVRDVKKRSPGKLVCLDVSGR